MEQILEAVGQPSPSEDCLTDVLMEEMEAVDGSFLLLVFRLVTSMPLLTTFLLVVCHSHSSSPLVLWIPSFLLFLEPLLSLRDTNDSNIISNKTCLPAETIILLPGYAIAVHFFVSCDSLCLSQLHSSP